MGKTMLLDLKNLFLCLFCICRLELIARARPTNGELLGLLYDFKPDVD
jgi:hypothetical protein